MTKQRKRAGERLVEASREALHIARRDRIITSAIHNASEQTGWNDAQSLIDVAVEATGFAEADVRRVYDARFRVYAP